MRASSLEAWRVHSEALGSGIVFGLSGHTLYICAFQGRAFAERCLRPATQQGRVLLAEDCVSVALPHRSEAHTVRQAGFFPATAPGLGGSGDIVLPASPRDAHSGIHFGDLDVRNLWPLV